MYVCSVHFPVCSFIGFFLEHRSGEFFFFSGYKRGCCYVFLSADIDGFWVDFYRRVYELSFSLLRLAFSMFLMPSRAFLMILWWCWCLCLKKNSCFAYNFSRETTHKVSPWRTQKRCEQVNGYKKKRTKPTHKTIQEVPKIDVRAVSS